MPSIQQCINSTDIPDDTADFFDIRIKENDAPVFCPMNLENPMDNVESICCGTCLSALENEAQQSDLEEAALAGEDGGTPSSAHRARYAHSLFLFISFSLPFFLIGCCFDADLL